METLEAARQRIAVYPLLTAVFELGAWSAEDGSGRAQRAMRMTMMTALPTPSVSRAGVERSAPPR
ncbi:MAG TPA: hypothetical protein VL625_06995 [Patescibacteria group bacterium]|nr:hypothetical protein [Patescibacteria group bacterium]